jgi:hypothetical protein
MEVHATPGPQRTTEVAAGPVIVSFNKVNTFAWYKKRRYELEAPYHPADREAAMKTAVDHDALVVQIARIAGSGPGDASRPAPQSGLVPAPRIWYKQQIAIDL